METKIDSVERGPTADDARRHDAALAERFACGDPAAFEEVVARYRDWVARLAFRLLRWSSDADDVVQEVFLAAIKNAKRFRRGASLETWLTTITLNKCRSHRRGLLSKLRMITRFARQEPPQAPPADAAPAEADLLAKVQQAIGKLSPRDRELIVLYYLEEKSIEQMAALVEAKRGAVEVRLHRARARLRELLGITEGDGI